jgi:hypothetical protein
MENGARTFPLSRRLFGLAYIALRFGHYLFVTHFNSKEQAMISTYIILTSTAHHGYGRKPSINENFG